MAARALTLNVHEVNSNGEDKMGNIEKHEISVTNLPADNRFKYLLTCTCGWQAHVDSQDEGDSAGLRHQAARGYSAEVHLKYPWPSSKLPESVTGTNPTAPAVAGTVVKEPLKVANPTAAPATPPTPPAALPTSAPLKQVPQPVNNPVTMTSVPTAPPATPPPPPVGGMRPPIATAPATTSPAPVDTPPPTLTKQESEAKAADASATKSDEAKPAQGEPVKAGDTVKIDSTEPKK